MRKQKSLHVNVVGLVTLLVANAVVLWQFIVNDGSILQVLWIYWLQSVIIGIVTVWRLLTVPVHANSTVALSGLTINTGKNSYYNSVMKVILSVFFTFHYGMFHFVYLIFLIVFAQGSTPITGISNEPLTVGEVFPGGVDIKSVMLAGLAFGIHHVLTFLIERHQLKLNPSEAPDTKEIMLRPYKRIMPMHLIIIFGPIIAYTFGAGSVFAFFILLKTVADIGLFFNGTSHPGKINSALTP